MAARTRVITLKLSESEDKQFKRVAASKGLPVSSMIRMLVKEVDAGLQAKTSRKKKEKTVG